MDKYQIFMGKAWGLPSTNLVFMKYEESCWNYVGSIGVIDVDFLYRQEIDEITPFKEQKTSPIDRQ